MSIIERTKDKVRGIFYDDKPDKRQDEETNTPKQQKLYNMVMGDFEVFRADRQKYEGFWEQEENFYAGEHWKGLRSGDAANLRPNAKDNLVFAYAEAICGKLAGWMPFPDYEAQEEGDTDKARALNDYIPYELRKIGFKETHRRAVLRMVKHGPLVYKVLYDPTIEGGRGMNRYEGRNDVVAVDFATFYPDPRVKTFKDMHRMGAVIQRSRQPIEYFCERWKGQGEKVTPDNEGEEVFDELNGNWGYSESSRRETCGLLEYWYRGLPKMMTKEDKQLFRDLADDALERNVDPSEFEAKAKGTMEGVHCIYVSTSGVFLEHKSYVYDHGQYPFVARTLYPLEGNPWGKGFVRDIISPQIFLNRYSEIIMDTLGRMGNGAIFYEEGAITKPGTWANHRGDPGAMLPVAPGMLDKIREVDGHNVPGSLFNIIDVQQLMIQKITGQFDSANGQASSAVTSGEQAKALMAAAGTRLNTASDVITDALEEVFWMLIELIAQFYKSERIARVNGRKVAIGRDFIVSRVEAEYTREEEIEGDQIAAPEMYRNAGETGADPMQMDMAGDPTVQEGMDPEMMGMMPGKMEPVLVQEEFVPEFDIRVNVGVDKPQDREYWLQLAFNLMNLRDPITQAPLIDAEAVSYVLQNGHMEPMDVIQQRIEEKMGQQQQVEQLNQQAQQMAQQNEELQKQLEEMGGELQRASTEDQQFKQQKAAAELDQKQQQIDLEKIKTSAQMMQQIAGSNPGQA